MFEITLTDQVTKEFYKNMTFELKGMIAGVPVKNDKKVFDKSKNTLNGFKEIVIKDSPFSYKAILTYTIRSLDSNLVILDDNFYPEISFNIETDVLLDVFTGDVIEPKRLDDQNIIDAFVRFRIKLNKLLERSILAVAYFEDGKVVVQKEIKY